MSAQSDYVVVWDRCVRLFHWGVVVAYAIAYFSAKDAAVPRAMVTGRKRAR